MARFQGLRTHLLIVLGIFPLQAKAASAVEFDQPVSRFYEDEGAAVLLVERSGDVDKAASGGHSV